MDITAQEDVDADTNRWEELMKANYKIMAALAGIALGALTIIVPGDAAQAQDTVRIRGTI